MALLDRKIILRFQLGEGAFGEDGLNVVEFTGLRCSVDITAGGGDLMTNCGIRVWGMPLDVMSKLTVINMSYYTSGRQNTVTVLAGDDVVGVAVAFRGIISEAWADAQSAPDVVFQVSAFTGIMESVRPVAPISFSGSVDVATVLAAICAQSSGDEVLRFRNYGVTTVMTDQYYPGTVRDQIRAVARHAGIEFAIDDDGSGPALSVWPKGGTRGTLVPLLSAETGMCGYPGFTQNGIRVTSLYNPSLTFGQTIEVRSSLDPANGNWQTFSVSHNLSSQMPGGPWFTQVEAVKQGQALPLGNS